MGLKHQIADRLITINARDIPNGKEVVERFAHLDLIHRNKAVVHPVMSKFLAVCRLRLGDLIFMMREDQVFATAMNINRISQILARHRRAFNMPAGTSFRPGRSPVRLARLCSLPQRKVSGMFLDITHFNTSARLQVFQRLMGQFAVILKIMGAEINIPICFIGITFIDQHLNKRNDLIHHLGNLWMEVGRHNVQPFGILLIFGNVPLGNC